MNRGCVAAFLDRDGTIIHDRHYLGDPAGVELLPGAARAIARLNAAGIPALLVTNQSGIGRGLFSEADFAAVQGRLISLLAREGARLDGVYHCPHTPDAEVPCECRKPAPGLFLRAAREHGVDLRRSFYIGDQLRDVLPAKRLGGVGILVRSKGFPEESPAGESIPSGFPTVDDLDRAVGIVLAAGARD